MGWILQAEGVSIPMQGLSKCKADYVTQLPNSHTSCRFFDPRTSKPTCCLLRSIIFAGKSQTGLSEVGKECTAGEDWSNSRDTSGGMPPARRMKVRLLGWLPRLASVLAQISVMRESEPQSSKCTSRCMAPVTAQRDAH